MPTNIFRGAKVLKKIKIGKFDSPRLRFAGRPSLRLRRKEGWEFIYFQDE